MSELIRLDDHRWQLNFERPTIEPYNIPVIRKLKQRVWILIWYNYLTQLVSLTKKSRSIINKENIRRNNLPHNIEFHIGKMDANEKGTLSKEISLIMKEISNSSLKEQLFYLRSKILASINNN